MWNVGIAKKEKLGYTCFRVKRWFRKYGIIIQKAIRRQNSMASLSLKNICKVYPNGFEAVKNFNLEIADKEFIIFVIASS